FYNKTLQNKSQNLLSSEIVEKTDFIQVMPEMIVDSQLPVENIFNLKYLDTFLDITDFSCQAKVTRPAFPQGMGYIIRTQQTILYGDIMLAAMEGQHDVPHIQLVSTHLVEKFVMNGSQMVKPGFGQKC